MSVTLRRNNDKSGEEEIKANIYFAKQISNKEINQNALLRTRD